MVASPKEHVMSRPLSLALAVALVCTACATDIRPESIEDGISEQAAAEGRAWLDKMAAAHGGVDRFRALGDAEVVLTDTWPGWLTRNAAMPWTVNGERMRVDMRTTTYDARLTFIGGERDGITWGIQNWATYTVPKGGKAVFEEDEDIWFWVPTVAYFVVMPWRIGEATTVAYTGDRTIGGREHAVVFATWGNPEPTDGVDHYIVYIDKETHRLNYAAYTIRDMALASWGAVHYEDFREVQGLQVPFKMTMAGDVEGEDPLHIMQIEKARFETGKPATHYVPDPSIKGSK